MNEEIHCIANEGKMTKNVWESPCRIKHNFLKGLKSIQRPKSMSKDNLQGPKSILIMDKVQ